MTFDHLAFLGWSSTFDQLFTTFRDQHPDPGPHPDPESHPSLEPARVVFESRQHYRVIGLDGERGARLRGRSRLDDTLPAVGDWVVVGSATAPDEPRTIHGVLPRQTCLSRKVAGQVTRQQVVAANVDHVFLVMGLDGDYNLRRLERFMVMARESQAEPVVVLTKADLSDDPIGARLDALEVAAGAAVFLVAALDGQGLEPLRHYLGVGQTVALIGSSGAGKSTLLNALCGSEVMRTGDVRQGDDRGRHTTTHRQLVQLPGGGLLVDNPGVREIQLWADEEALAEAFEDIEALARGCRFRDCGHHDEPGCHVQLALREGRLEPRRFANWQDIAKEVQRLETKRNVAEQRKVDRQLGQLYKTVQRAKQNRRNRP